MLLTTLKGGVYSGMVTSFIWIDSSWRALHFRFWVRQDRTTRSTENRPRKRAPSPVNSRPNAWPVWFEL